MQQNRMHMNDNNWTLPNAITIARIIMVPAFMAAFINDRLDAALFIFVLAGASDALDGFLARVLGQRSRLGAMLDPVADKLLLITAYMSLGLGGLVAGWLVVLVISREMMLIVGMALLYFRGVNVRDRIQPTWISKFNNWPQILLIIAVLAVHSFGFSWQGLIHLLVATVSVSTVLSGAHYIYLGVGLLPKAKA